jgi:hypothetical protein
MLKLCENQFDPNGYWHKPIAKLTFIPTTEDIDLFDQNGYDLTHIEQHYASSNEADFAAHRKHIVALKKPWFVQDKSYIEGAVLNHSLLFERKAYAGPALEQLQYWSQKLPLLHKIIAMRPKWGLDFSMDYADREGNALELLHWEWDSFNYDEIQNVKSQVEPILLNIDWADAARGLLARKNEWFGLDFFAQSDWKCKYFGIIKERFKMVIWN